MAKNDFQLRTDIIVALYFTAVKTRNCTFLYGIDHRRRTGADRDDAEVAIIRRCVFVLLLVETCGIWFGLSPSCFFLAFGEANPAMVLGFTSRGGPLP